MSVIDPRRTWELLECRRISWEPPGPNFIQADVAGPGRALLGRLNGLCQRLVGCRNHPNRILVRSAGTFLPLAE